jgi:hypothetical protein
MQLSVEARLSILVLLILLLGIIVVVADSEYRVETNLESNVHYYPESVDALPSGGDESEGAPSTIDF